MKSSTQRVSVLALLLLVMSSVLPYAGDGDFIWQERQSKVLPGGDLEWAPKPFVFEAGGTMRYIDFEAGDDNNSGESKDAAWKHHPWDREATGKAKGYSGVATYVFKGGVTYRGKMYADDSGTDAKPIRLTTDPTWGNGMARIFGSKRVEGEWKRGAPGTKIPEPEKVWHIDLPDNFDIIDHRPDRNDGDETISHLWVIDGDNVHRMHLARTPNYTDADPLYPFQHWHHWQVFDGAQRSGWLIDDQWKGKPKDYFEGGVYWTQHRHLMGTPFRQEIDKDEYDPERGALKVSAGGGVMFRPFYNYDFKEPYKLEEGRVGYFIERLPQFLDAPYEYYYSWQGQDKGRLYVRLPEGKSPDNLIFEAGVLRSPLEIRDQSNIVVSGIDFMFNDGEDNTYSWPPQVGASPMVRIIGNCSDITVKNCSFSNCMQAVVAFPRPEPGDKGPPSVWQKEIGNFNNDFMTRINVTDCDLINIEHADGISAQGNGENPRGKPFGTLADVTVLRNRIRNCSFRGGVGTSSLAAIYISHGRVVTVAGNHVTHSWGNGAFVSGGKNGNSGAANEIPLLRTLMYDNKLVDTMIGCCDYGGLNFYQGGPSYIYNNIIHNAIGSQPFSGTEMGYNLYLDGAFKVYSFNNILTGRVDEDNPNYYNHCGYFMVFGFLNNFWNNTVQRFQYGVNGSSGNRSAVLGNVFVDMQKTFLGQNRPGDASMEYGGDTGVQGAIGIATMSYADNVFFGDPKGGYQGKGNFGYVGGTAKGDRKGKATVYSGNTLEELSNALENMKARDASIGVHVNQNPLSDEGFVPQADSAAIDGGVKFFVPWALARTVGEWNFQQSKYLPRTIVGEHFYMQEEYFRRDCYYFSPRNDLTVQGDVSPDDYIDSETEDWVPGALRFDGNRFASLSHAEMTKDITYPFGFNDQGKVVGGKEYTWKGTDRRTLDMSDNNFLIEVIAQQSADGILAAKQADGKGYELAVSGGKLQLTLNGKAHTFDAAIAKDQWFHIIAEVDRKAGVARLYLDGKLADEQKLLIDNSASLANTADFIVGKGLSGAIDFVRVSQGTLADAQTTIEELYAWQFNGPQFRDFTGAEPAGQGRDAGALERK